MVAYIAGIYGPPACISFVGTINIWILQCHTKLPSCYCLTGRKRTIFCQLNRLLCLITKSCAWLWLSCSLPLDKSQKYLHLHEAHTGDFKPSTWHFFDKYQFLYVSFKYTLTITLLNQPRWKRSQAKSTLALKLKSRLWQHCQKKNKKETILRCSQQH